MRVRIPPTAPTRTKVTMTRYDFEGMYRQIKTLDHSAWYPHGLNFLAKKMLTETHIRTMDEITGVMLGAPGSAADYVLRALIQWQPPFDPDNASYALNYLAEIKTKDLLQYPALARNVAQKYRYVTDCEEVCIEILDKVGW